MSDHFKMDGLEILAMRAAKGEIRRRDFVKGAALLMATPLALRATTAFAADNLVVANWGGDALTAYKDAFADVFNKTAGMGLTIDGSGPTEGAIKAQIASGKVIWDVIDTDPNIGIDFGRKGNLEAIDYSVVDRSKVHSHTAHEFAVGNFFVSYVLAYDSEKYAERPPVTPADFWNVSEFPGKRTMYKWMNGMVEAALLADGVPKDKLYPLDIDRALSKIEELKPHIISFWGSGADSQQALLEGEASMGYVWSTRAGLMERDTDGKIKSSFDSGFLAYDAWMVLKQNPAGKQAAMQFIAAAQDPEAQAILFKLLGNGPINPEAEKFIPADQQKFNPGSAENVAKQVLLDAEWYTDNYSASLEKFLAMVSG